MFRYVPLFFFSILRNCSTFIFDTIRFFSKLRSQHNYNFFVSYIYFKIKFFINSETKFTNHIYLQNRQVQCARLCTFWWIKNSGEIGEVGPPREVSKEHIVGEVLDAEAVGTEELEEDDVSMAIEGGEGADGGGGVRMMFLRWWRVFCSEYLRWSLFMVILRMSIWSIL